LSNPYQIDTTGDEDTYLFITDQDIEYIIQMFDYSYQLPDPISGKLFTFNFFRKTDKEKGEEPDNRIKDTVIHFLSDFLHKNDNSVVTICETIDKKELARHKLFHKWFEELEIKQVKKIDREIELDEYFIPASLFIHDNNPERDFILSFFENMNFEC
jgi:hypothetical protein